MGRTPRTPPLLLDLMLGPDPIDPKRRYVLSLRSATQEPAMAGDQTSAWTRVSR